MGINYTIGIFGDPAARLGALADAIDWILEVQLAAASKVENDELKEKEHQRFQNATLELSKAFALAAASDFAREVKEEIGFFQAIRSAIEKSSTSDKLSTRSKQFAIEQLINSSVAKAEIVDILRAAGLQTPDIPSSPISFSSKSRT